MSVAYEAVQLQSGAAARVLSISFRIRNRGRATWRQDDQFCVGWQLYDPATGLFIAEGDWSAIQSDIPPGQGCSIHLSVELPDITGDYDIYVSPRSESTGWFFEQQWPFILVRTTVDGGAVRVREWRIITKGRLWIEQLPRRLQMALWLPFAGIARHWRLAMSLARRDLLARYRGSFGDVLWTFLHPLLLMLTYFFVFGVVLQTRFAGDPSRSGFVLYFLAGMLPWLPFSEAVGRAPSVVLEHRNIVKKVVFPVQILPVSLVMSSLASQGFAVLIFLAFLLATRGYIPWSATWLPVLLGPQLLLSLGLCWLLAATGVYLRDLGQIIGFALTLWFFLTPICYPEASLPAAALPILEKNPMYVMVRGYRAILLEETGPDRGALIALWFGSWVVFTAGYAWFHRLRRSFADVI
jgi:lipopolysaccharide transport system permease protein